MNQIYPTISFSSIDYTKIPKGGTFIAFNLDNDGKLSRLDYLGNISVIGENTSSENYEFYYNESSPIGSGTDQIKVGSIWYSTKNNNSYVYVYDGESYFWITLSQPGPKGDSGNFEPPKLTTDEILSIQNPIKGMIVYNITLDLICVYVGSSWKTVNQQELIL
jgi:hypothetical protein